MNLGTGQLNQRHTGKVILKNLVMKAKAVVLLLTCLLSFPGFGQADKTISVNIGVGMRSLPVEEFKSFYEFAPGLSSTLLDLGGSVYAGIGNFTLGLKGNVMNGRERVTDQFVYSAQGGNIMLSAGYCIAGNRNINFIPMASAGLAMVSYYIDSKFSVDLNDPVNSPLNSGTYIWNNYVFEFGARIQKNLKGDAEGRFFTHVSFEGGYYLSPASDDWTNRSGAFIFNAPEYAPRGWYLSLIFGGQTRL